MTTTNLPQKFPKVFRLIAEFIRLETSAGILLFAAAVLALLLDNSPLSHFYEMWIYRPFSIQLQGWHFSTTAIFWINDFLMVIFFLLVGLEIKREILIGELNSLQRVILPAIGAVGGMIVPALVYLAFNATDKVAITGWAIPTATDIAFALGILSLLGKRVPVGLKLYLMALAIFDDLGAILIITFFYQTHLSWLAMLGVLVCLLALFALNRLRVKTLWIYGVLGILMWVFFLKSGIHPTISGVLLALMIPLNGVGSKEGPEDKSPLRRLERGLHPWVAYGILPLFGFANAGISFSNLSLNQLFGSIPLGILLGLFIGKQVGVFVATGLAIRLGVAQMPKGGSWFTLYAIAIICGVGFTMSLFIGSLAFGIVDTDYTASVRFGVLAGSGLSGVLGYLLLYKNCCKKST